MTGEPVPDSVTIPDCDGFAFLKIESLRDDSFLVTLQHRGVSGEVGYCCFEGCKNLGDYFLDMAREWKGWEGSRSWDTPGLKISATHDRRSRVRLEVELCPFASPESWALKATINVAPGELEGIGSDLRSLYEGHDLGHHS